MLKNFYEKYINLNLSDYGIKLDLEINKLLIIIFIGLCIACFIVNYNQSQISLVLKKLIRAEAFGEANAKTLADLGLSNSKTVKKLLSKTEGPLKSIITFVGAKSLSYEEFLALEKARRKKRKVNTPDKSKEPSNREKTADSGNCGGNSADALSIDFASAKFYIKEDMVERANEAFVKNNSSVSKTALLCVLLLGCCVALIFLMPLLLRLVQGILK